MVIANTRSDAKRGQNLCGKNGTTIRKMFLKFCLLQNTNIVSFDQFKLIQPFIKTVFLLL